MMIPSENAGSNHHISSRITCQNEKSGSIFLQASKVSIQVRPRSPGRSLAKFLPNDTSRRANVDISPQKNVCVRPVVHLEVDQQRRGDPRQPGSKPNPSAVIDVVQVPSSRVPPIAPPPDAAANAAVSITVLPVESRTGNGLPASALLVGNEPVAKRSTPAGRQHAGVASNVHATGPSIASHKSGRNAWEIQSASGAAAEALVPARQPAPAIAASLAVATTASASATAEQTVTVPHPAVIGLPDQRPAAVAPPRTGKSGGAALLAELLGQHFVTAAASTAYTDAQNAMPGRSGQPEVTIPGPRAVVSRPVVAVTDNADAAFRESRSLLLSWDQGLPATAALAGIPDPEEEARRARRRHRKRVARIVVDHWKQFAREGLRVVAARRHLRRRRLTAAWVSWQAETANTRSRMRLAAVYDLKRAYMGLGRCVQAWSAIAKRLAQLRALQERIACDRLLRQSRACLRAWRWRCYNAAEKQRRRLQAWFYYCFSTLTRVMRKWHDWAAHCAALARQAAWAEGQHLKQLRRKALTAWRQRVALRTWKSAAAERARGFRSRWTLRGALQAWRNAIAMCKAAREAASAALVAAVAGIEEQRATAAFVEWKVYAVQRRRRRQRERYGMAYMRRWWQLVVMWAWRQRMVRSRHLRICERHLQRVGRHVRLGLCWSRWCLAVEVLQGQRNAELRTAVLIRASWAAWRAVVEHRAAKRELSRIAIQRVAHVVARAALAAWRDRTAHWQVKAARWELAVASHRRRALTRLLQVWRREAGRLASKAAAMQAAQWHRRRTLLGKAVRMWRRYAWRKWMKAVAAEHYLGRLLRCTLLRWHRHSRYKARKEMDRRRAIRHRYLTLLHAVLHAFQSAVARRLAKQADWADLGRLHSLHVARAVMRAWRHEVLPIALVKRAVARRAEKHRNATLLRHALAGWLQQAARLAAKHARLREAVGFAALQLLRRTIFRWAAAAALREHRRATKAVRLTGLVAALAAASARRLLAAWRDVHQDMILKRFQGFRAQESWRDRTLRRAMTRWALYLARRRVASLHNARALAAYRGRVSRSVLEVLLQHTARRRSKRRLAAVASEYRRVGLLRRSIMGLVRYASYRAAKFRGYILARTLYVRRLQRDGAAAWLQVGTERRRQRIELLAAQQAHNLVQELARVEPFARRWLNVVRCKWRQAPWRQSVDATAAAPYTVTAANAATRRNPYAQRSRGSPQSASAWQLLPKSVCSIAPGGAVLGTDHGVPLRGPAAAVPYGPSTTGANWASGRIQCPSGASRGRPPPRCPDFLLRRSVTVGSPSGASTRVPYGRPASSAAPAIREIRGDAHSRPASTFYLNSGNNKNNKNVAAAGGAGPEPEGLDRSSRAEAEARLVLLPNGSSWQNSKLGCGAGMALQYTAGTATWPISGQPALPSQFADCPPHVRGDGGSPSIRGDVAAAGDHPGLGYGVIHLDRPIGFSCQQSAAGGYSGEYLDSAAKVIAAVPPVSRSPSLGITIHRPGPRSPDIFRLPSHGEGSLVDEGIAVGDTGGQSVEDARTWGCGLSQQVTVQPGRLGHNPAPASSNDRASSVHNNDLGGQTRAGTNGVVIVGTLPKVPGHGRHQEAAPGEGSTPEFVCQQKDWGGEEILACTGVEVEPRLCLYPIQQDSLGSRNGHDKQPQQNEGPMLDEGELLELESVLLHCKHLKGRLQHLENLSRNTSDGAGNASAVTAVGEGESSIPGSQNAAARALGTSFTTVVLWQQQAADVRAALAALRPTVEYAAARLQQIRKAG
ncbi:hypothetical protein Vretimale_9020 [Volvox reticuliferus]|uniref:Sfi1 spindle body domain-containing protein n=1 Tax=Volvox reticuliferus TaxID=1737510 RepID=A0A8J4CPL6_9CHLO|nr:hypothetical protein Vretifemale_14478 [Volvox reticuliferus]GIM04438.1 hypothetical protein Vretimale_9020 [Volvox reticuliferus]